MFKFKLEPENRLLTVTRKGFWSLATVAAYEVELRQQLTRLHNLGRPTSFIIDIRPSGAQTREVASGLRAMVAGLGPLHADRTAVVTSSGIAKLQAARVADDTAKIFTSMVSARSWLTNRPTFSVEAYPVHNEPSEAEAEGRSVHITGPADVDVLLSPAAALETAKRIGEAAVEALLANASVTAGNPHAEAA